MFCEKCGNQLPDTADFCPKCGNEFNIIMNTNANNNVDRNTVIFEVKPSFKFSYVVLPKLLKELIYLIPMIAIAIYFISTMNRMTAKLGNTSSISMTTYLPILLIIIGILLLKVVITLVKSVLEKKQYENYVYTFYSDRVIFRDSFLNVSEKELKYKYIREITKRQSFIQRYFNIGNIVLFSNAETGFVSGIFMINIENVDNVYKQIKEIINV